LEISLPATAAPNALDHGNIATTRIYDHRTTRFDGLKASGV
jgi:hypothetical protein